MVVNIAPLPTSSTSISLLDFVVVHAISPQILIESFQKKHPFQKKRPFQKKHPFQKKRSILELLRVFGNVLENLSRESIFRYYMSYTVFVVYFHA